MFKQALQAARAIVGSYIDAKLDAWAKRVCEERPADVSAPNSTNRGDNGICGYVIPDRDTGDPYITRILFPRVFGMRPMLHHIHRPDYARDFHDHPWDVCISLILRGSYDEERPASCHHNDCTETVTRRVRWFNVIRDTDWHRITQLHGNVWTLFIAGERVQPWGFRVWDSTFERFEKVPHSLYKHEPKAEPDEQPDGNIDELIAFINRQSGRYLDTLAGAWEVEPRRFPANGAERESDSDLRARLVDKVCQLMR